MAESENHSAMETETPSGTQEPQVRAPEEGKKKPYRAFRRNPEERSGGVGSGQGGAGRGRMRSPLSCLRRGDPESNDAELNQMLLGFLYQSMLCPAGCVCVFTCVSCWVCLCLQSVMSRVSNLALVSSACDAVSSAYSSTKESIPVLKEVMDAAESGVRTLSTAASSGAKPILDKLEPQSEILTHTDTDIGDSFLKRDTNVLFCHCSDFSLFKIIAF